MPTCYICEINITNDNKSTEHIILNAFGGKLKSDNLLCKNCNSKFGHIDDSEIAKQFNGIACLLNIERERGEPQPIKATFEKTKQEYWLTPSGKQLMAKPEIKVIVEGEEIKISICANDEVELKQILTGLKRKYPSIDIEKFISDAKSTVIYPDEHYNINYTFGGQKSLRSICKTAINFYIHEGGSRQNIAHLIPFLKGEVELDMTHIIVLDQPIHKIDKDEVSHLLHIKGDSKNKLLYGIVELFNSCTFLIQLSKNYQGEDFSKTYCYDVLTKEIKNKEIILVLNAEEINSYNYKTAKINWSIVKKSIGRVVGIGLERQKANHIKIKVEEAISNSLKKYQEGVIITQEMAREFELELMKSLTPFINRYISKE